MRAPLIVAALLCLSSVNAAEVTYDRLVHALDHPSEWLTYWGDYHATRFRDLRQINDRNVGELHLEWLYQTGTQGSNETVPLVVNGVMYLTTPDSGVDALDARSGRRLWHYQYRIPKDAKYCCGNLNRGLAILGRRLYMLTPDTRLLAIDSRNGALLWNVEVASSAGGAYGGTEAPLIVKDKVVLGTAAGDYGIRGFVDAYDAETGKRVWRFWTVPVAGEPGVETWGGDSWKTAAARRG